jgi:metal-responsive CopG/Arc/MetJ family transcriptional regulator
MARKEVLVQLDDGLVSRLDELATAQGTSRSELIRRGAIAVLEAADLADADRQLRDAYRKVPQDPALVQAARSFAARAVHGW